MSTLTAVVLTYNEEKHLPDCLASLAWVPEVLVFDSLSTDRTLEIARSAGARVEPRRFDNYAEQRNAALKAISTEWVLFVDADERATPELAQAVQTVLNGPEAGWWIPRHNYLFGKLTQYAGWYPDYQLRLLRRAQARYDAGHPVHEIVKLEGAAGYLSTPLIHLNYETVAEFIAKQKYYARYDAQGLAAAGVRVKTRHFLLQPLRHFYWRWIQLAGWRGGWHTLRLSLFMSYFELEKYHILAKGNHQC